MRDVDQGSEYGTEDDDPAAIGGTVDWLGRPYYEGEWSDKVRKRPLPKLDNAVCNAISPASSAKDASRCALHEALC